MTTTEAKKAKTKERILMAASDVFIEHGFEKATVREICAKAEANVAAINYHFRDKRELFRMVILDWQREAQEMFPLDKGVGPDSSDEERFLFFYSAMLNRIFYEAGHDKGYAFKRARVWMGELASGGLRQLDKEEDEYCQMEDYLAPIIEKMLGTKDDTLVRDTIDSCISQIVTYFVGYVYDPSEFDLISEPGELDRIAKHMTKFALGGIRAIKENIDA